MLISAATELMYFIILITAVTLWVSIYLFYLHIRDNRHRIFIRFNIERLQPSLHFELYYPDSDSWN